jgi:hypothetical protein
MQVGITSKGFEYLATRYRARALELCMSGAIIAAKA